MLTRDSSRRIPELDGIRGAAILSILVYHWVYQQASSNLPNKLVGLFSFGWSGVDLFFVLSGFLIGGILLDARDSGNYFKVFYVRRFYRILPLYAVFCLWSVAVFYIPLATHEWLFGGPPRWYAYLTFGQNFWMAKDNSWGAADVAATWSLAVEEQFYLTLPFVISFVSRKKLPYVLGAGVLLAPIIRVALWFAVDPARREITTYVLAPCRMDSLLLGVLAACAVRNAACWNWLVAHTAITGTASAFLGAGILEMIHKRMGRGTFALTSFGYTWVALFYLSLLLLAVTQHGLVSRVFRFRVLTELGMVAYGLYLFHAPLLGLVYGLAGRSSPDGTGLSKIVPTVLSGLLLFALARLSWIYFEKPLVRRGHRYHYEGRDAVATTAR